MTGVSGQFTSSVNGRIKIASKQFAAGVTLTPASTLLTSIFPLDPNCPFHRIFASASVALANESWYSTYQFSLGGVPAGDSCTGIWGDPTTYPGTASNPTGLQITPSFGDDAITFWSQFTGTATTIGSGRLFQAPANINSGFLSRWCALADSVTINTRLASPLSTTNGNLEVFHGVIQQPWN